MSISPVIIVSSSSSATISSSGTHTALKKLIHSPIPNNADYTPLELVVLFASFEDELDLAISPCTGS